MKKTLLFSFFLFSLFACEDDQSLTYVQATTFFGPNNSIYHTGHTKTESGSMKAVLWKVNQAGKTEWTYAMPASSESAYNQVKILADGSVLLYALDHDKSVLYVSASGQQVWRADPFAVTLGELIHVDAEEVWFSGVTLFQNGLIKLSMSTGEVLEEIYPPMEPSYLIGSLQFGYFNGQLYAAGVGAQYKPIFMQYDAITEIWESTLVEESMLGGPQALLFDEDKITVSYMDNEFLQFSSDGAFIRKFSLDYEDACYNRFNFTIQTGAREFLIFDSGKFTWITVDSNYNTVKTELISDDFELYNVQDIKVVENGVLASVNESDINSFGTQHFILFKADGSFEIVE